ncbi:MAG: hypothetical protein JNM51_12795 [Bacteroidia bacterium]|nr:hypothetical protein [Bacteroidia bacterium]
MNRSDWIALAACIAAFLGLIPQFRQMSFDRKDRKKIKKSSNKSSLKKTDLSSSELNSETAKDKSPEEQKPRPLYNAFIQTIAAVLIFLIELILFSALAYFFNVKVELDNMPLLWTVGFYAIFVVPGLLLFMAFMWLSSAIGD